MKLKNKIAIIFFLVGFLLLTAMNVTWLFSTIDESQNNALTVQLGVAKNSVNQIESLWANNRQAFEDLAFLLGLANQSYSKKDILLRFLNQNPDFVEVAVLGFDGQEEIRAYRSDDQIVFPSDLKNQADQDYFIKIFQSKDNFYAGDFLFLKDNQLGQTLAILIQGEGTGSGVLVGKLKLSMLTEVINNIQSNKDNRVFLVNNNGNLIFGSSFSFKDKNQTINNFPPVKKIIRERKEVTGLDKSDSFLDSAGKKVFTVAVPFKTLPGGLVIEQKTLPFVTSISGRFVVFALISIIGAILLFSAAKLTAGYSLGPLRRLEEMTKIIGAGDFSQKIDLKTGDEVENLAKSFNAMTEKLKEAYSSLEQKVAERTKELQAQRDELYETTQKLIVREKALVELKKEQEAALEEARKAKKKAEEARLATLNILEDVDEARRSQEAEKNKMEAALKGLTDGLIVLDQAGAIELLNERAEKILNIKREEVTAKKISDIEAGEMKILNQLLVQGGGTLDKKEMTTKGPPERVVEVSTAPVISADGKNMGGLIILHDVTREKTIERMKSEFVSIAAHQLRTPLSAIKWTLRLVLDRDIGPISDEQEQILEKGYKSNERMIALINDLLNVARIEEGRTVYKFAEVDFSQIVSHVLEALRAVADSKNIKLDFKKPRKKCFIRADQEKIELAIENLVENAINYSPGRSTVTIACNCDKVNLTFSVKDSGMGIPKEQQDRIFTKFFRSDNAVRAETEGTGLGLFITKNIIESHGGRIWFESEENKGSTFYFTLPLIK